MPKGYKKNVSLNVSSVETALNNNQGVYLHACKELGVHRRILSNFVKEHPDLEKLVMELRHHWVENTCDGAEAVIQRIMNNVDNPATSLKAAMFHLNNQAKKRGYAHPEADNNENKMTPAQALAIAGLMEVERGKLMNIATKSIKTVKAPINKKSPIKAPLNKPVAKKIVRKRGRPCKIVE